MRQPRPLDLLIGGILLLLLFTEHPWLDWLYVVIVFGIGATLVWGVVRAMIAWAHKDNETDKKK